jgi:RimJ/RimL family protein N-acetyltransferase
MTLMPAFDRVTLDTARLQLRPLVPADAAALLAIHADAEVMRYSNTPPWTSVDQAQALIDRDLKGMATGRHLCLGIVPAGEGSVVGTCTLFGLGRASRRAELGFALGRFAWGRGWMNEALTALAAFGFGHMQLNRLEADIDPRNRASARTLLRLGCGRRACFASAGSWMARCRTPRSTGSCAASGRLPGSQGVCRLAKVRA